MTIDVKNSEAVIRESRLGAITGYEGTIKDLVTKASSCSLTNRERCFSQASACMSGCAQGYLSGIVDTVVVNHAPVGCAADSVGANVTNKWGLKVRGWKKTNINLVSTNMTEEDTVFGAAGKLQDAVREVYRRFQPKAIFVTTSCVSGIIGEDIVSILSALKDEIPIPLAPVSCEGFKSKVWASGFDAAFHAILTHIVKPPLTKTNKVNMVNFRGSAKDEITAILARLGLEPLFVAPFSTVEQLSKVPTQTSFNETNIADELGYFKEEGIQIQYTRVIKPGLDIQTVATGVNDAFISGHPNNVAQARLAGVKVVAVAPGMVDNPDFPHVRYLVRDDSPIKSLGDIVGKKVAISNYGVCTDGYLKLWLKQENQPLNVNWVVLPDTGQQEQALKQGLIEVATSHPPYAGVALKQGGVRQIATSYDIVKTPAAGLSVRGFSERFVKEHPDVVKGFCRAMYKARVWINHHQKEAAEMIAKRLKLKPEQVSVFWYDEEQNINPSYIETWFKISQDVGLWKAGDIKPTDIYTNQFAPKSS